MKKNIVILISGRGSNMLAILDSCEKGDLQDKVEVAGIFSNDPGALGISAAQSRNYPVKVITSKGKKRQQYNQELLNWLREIKPNYLILAGYMLIIPALIIKEFPARIINIHPADTRQHQGLHGYKWAWEQNLKETKITVHFVDEGLDTGRIIGQKPVNLSSCYSLEQVEHTGLKVEHQFYSEVLTELFSR